MKRKKNYTPLLTTLGLVAALALLLTLSLSVWFPIKNCTIEGESRYTPEQLAAALGLAENRQNLFTADLKALEAKLCKALPYIESAELRRNPPGTLRLTLRESQAAFAVQQDKAWWLLDANGKILEQAAKAPKGALPLTGATLAAPKLGLAAKWGKNKREYAFQPLLRLLEEMKLRKEITEVRLGVDPTPELMYQDRIRIIFGPMPKNSSLSVEEVLRRKLDSAVKIIAKERPNQKGIVDLSIFGYEVFTPDWTV